MSVNKASQAQIAAANPVMSTWLTANAGSGKTKVLTDRVARLLLLGVDPQSILCLTYTKAAASEMQNRLFQRLGAWAMLPEMALRAELEAAGVEGVADLDLARTLFARAIEVPGGLKIQTIHAFAATLLRRFPMEAGISPDFREIDDVEAAALRRDVVTELEGRRPDLITDLARFGSDDDLDGYAKAITDARKAFPAHPTRESVAKGLGLNPALTPQALFEQLLGRDGAETFSALENALPLGTATDKKTLNRLKALNLDHPGPEGLAALEGLFLYGEGAKSPFGAKVGKFPGKDARSAMGPAAVALDAMMERAEALREPRLALAALDRTLALHRFAAAFLPAYQSAKSNRGALDFDDLIARADALLSDDAVSNWVLYRIDGDIEHVLIDEAQDTSPAQWEFIQKLTQELTAGQGAETVIPRSMFVVGDLKQSIYSFQGADPREMERMERHFKSRLAGRLARHDLQYSFRSSSAILRVVDQTFAPLVGQGVGEGAAHYAFHHDLPGRVDIWPIEEPSKKPEPLEWHDPRDIITPSDPVARLSSKIAAEVARWVKTETIPVQNGMSRPVRPQDILILFKSRKPLFHQTIRACKEAGLQVAGADRVLLQDELAVQDIMSVLAFLALPEDDLALAEALRSPLFGWSEGDLFDLAHGRAGAYLWEALRAAADQHEPTLDILNDLRDQADYLRPFEVIDRLLTRHRGRERLLARLGDEAEEGIDALLEQAMIYEQGAAPSLTGFVSWYSARDIEVKRQAGTAEAGIRVMTIHGAKGLESPIVILPDTLDDQVRTETLLVGPDGAPHLHIRQNDRPAALEAAAVAQAQASAEERQRLLYVAMTRAENWLVVGAAGEAPKKGLSWYELVSAGIEATGPTTPLPLADGTNAQRYEEGRWDRPLEVQKPDESQSKTDPEWLDATRAAPEKALPILPSSLGGAKALPGDSGAEESVALAYGSALHLLLEHLPQVPAERRGQTAARLLAAQPEDISRPATNAALRLLSDPHLSHLFSDTALAEVEFAARPAAFDGQLVTGSIDRLIIAEGLVTAIDFKSNRQVPTRPEDTPEGILRQMGAYAAALADLYPNHRIQTAILWTETAQLMSLPHDIVRNAVNRTAIS